MNDKGLIHIYTGYGKGKTTCGVGLALRALGHNKKVVYCYFHKNPEKYGYNEIMMLEKCGAKVLGFAKGTPLFNKSLTFQELSTEVALGIDILKNMMLSEPIDLLVMDEILISIRDGYLAENALVEFIEYKPALMELVMTGRDATTTLKEIADYVSVIQKEKHPYDKGTMAREGIEY